MAGNFVKSLFNLIGGSVQVAAGNGYPQEGTASVFMRFADGTELAAEYWRLTRDGKAELSSFDHRQKYGLPAPIDAVEKLQHLLQDKTVIGAQLDDENGDLLFQFTENVKLQVFNFTAYEIWHIRFPGGAEEYSNYNR